MKICNRRKDLSGVCFYNCTTTFRKRLKEMTSFKKMSSLGYKTAFLIIILREFYSSNPSSIVAPFFITTIPSFTTNKE